MRLARLCIPAVLAVLAVGCGGSMEEVPVEEAPQVPEVSEGTGDGRTVSAQAYVCVGWDNGARYCLVDCHLDPWGDGVYEYVGSYPSIGFGDCNNAAYNYCARNYGHSARRACWGVWQ